MIDPKDVADRLTDDPDIINEDLYGVRVAPGTSQVDQLVRWVEANYKDWDVTDPDFQMAFYKIFRAPTSVGVTSMIHILKVALEKRSMQNDELKKKLIGMMQTQLSKTPQSNVPVQGKIHMKNGNVIEGKMIVNGASKGLNPRLLWVGVGPNPKHGGRAWPKRPMRHRGTTRALKIRYALPEIYTSHGYQKDGAMGRYKPRGHYFQLKYDGVLTINKDNISHID
jgi:hypothetical protein